MRIVQPLQFTINMVGTLHTHSHSTICMKYYKWECCFYCSLTCKNLRMCGSWLCQTASRHHSINCRLVFLETMKAIPIVVLITPSDQSLQPVKAEARVSLVHLCYTFIISILRLICNLINLQMFSVTQKLVN